MRPTGALLQKAAVELEGTLPDLAVSLLEITRQMNPTDQGIAQPRTAEPKPPRRLTECPEVFERQSGDLTNAGMDSGAALNSAAASSASRIVTSMSR